MSLAKKHPSNTPSGQKLILRQLPTSRMGRSANQPCVHHLAQGRHGVVLPAAVCRSSSTRFHPKHEAVEGLISASPIATIMANLMASTIATVSPQPGNSAVFSSLPS